MHFNKPEVTLRDKKKAKTTIKLFSAFTAFFAVLSVLSIVFMPKAKTIVGIDNKESNEIDNIFSINYGEQYVATSKTMMQVYDADTNKVLSNYPYKDLIFSKLAESDIALPESVFINQAPFYTNTSENNGFVLLFDTNGDLFRIDVNDGEFVLSNDYYLVDRFTLNAGGQETSFTNIVKPRSIYIDNDDLYVLAVNNNKFLVNIFDLNNLSAGVKKTKKLYSFKIPSDDEIYEIEQAYNEKIKPFKGDNKSLRYERTPFYVVDPIVTNNAGDNIYDLYVEGDKMFVLSTAGVRYWNTDLEDFPGVSIYNDASSYYLEMMRTELLGIDDDTKARYGISNELFASLPTASTFIVESLFKTVFRETYFAKTKEYFGKTAKFYEDWLAYLDPTLSNLSYAVFADQIDGTDKTAFADKGSTVTIGGFIYSPKTKTSYFLNDKNNTMYSISSAQIAKFEFGGTSTLLDKAEETGIVLKGKTLFENHNSMAYDYVGDSIHVLYQNDKEFTIIDVSSEGAKVRYTLSSQYDIAAINEKKDGSKLIIFYKTEKVTFNNVVTTPYHIDVINPNTYRYHDLFLIFTIVFIALVVVCAVIIFISLGAFKKDQKMLKLKVIHRDLKRNKWTYVTLIPFIVLLIMFCYVEAVGSISFSFFSYTMDHPSYIWNDFGNYISIFNDSQFWLMFGNTFFFLVFDLILGIVPPIFFAFCLSIIKSKKLSGVLRALMFIPAIVPGIASLLIWKIGIFGNTGVLNVMTCFFRTGSASSPDYTPIEFLVDPDISRWALLLIGFPYVGGYLIFYGGLMNIPNEYHEASQLEGLNVVERFFKIDLPLITPQIKYIFVMGILSSAQNYERTYMLGSTGTTTLVESMYRQMKDYTNYGKASAYATIIFLLLLVPVLINFKDTRKTNLGDQI